MQTGPHSISSFAVAASAIAVMATIAYCLASAYLSMMCSIVVGEPTMAPRLSVWAIPPMGRNPDTYLWHWHLLAYHLG